MNACANGVHGEIGDEAEELCKSGNKEGENEFPSLVLEVLLNEPRNPLIALVIYENVDESWDKSSWKGELYAFAELEAIVLDGG